MVPHLFDWPWWGYVIFALGVTQLTVACLDLYLHRAMAHQAIRLPSAIRHAMRFWLWLTTGLNTREWVAVHRQHHADADGRGGPDSPLPPAGWVRLLNAARVYRRARADGRLLARRGQGCPDDWIERRLYRPFRELGVVLMLAINVVLFGLVIGGGIWMLQMAGRLVAFGALPPR